MKTKFKLAEIKVNVPGSVFGKDAESNFDFTFGGIEVEMDATIPEIKAMYDLQVQAIREIPKIIKNYVDEMDEYFEEESSYPESMLEDLQ